MTVVDIDLDNVKRMDEEHQTQAETDAQDMALIA
jgi:hypothetical protein